MRYDYQEFPVYTYEVSYSRRRVPGAGEQSDCLDPYRRAAMHERDRTRGFDHGAFVPLSVIYPEANLPVVQLSLDDGLDPQAHLQLGRALTPLRNEGVMIVGSGMSFHGTGLNQSAAKAASKAFVDRLSGALQQSTGTERADRMARWAMRLARGWHIRAKSLIDLLARYRHPAAVTDAGSVSPLDPRGTGLFRPAGTGDLLSRLAQRVPRPSTERRSAGPVGFRPLGLQLLGTDGLTVVAR